MDVLMIHKDFPDRTPTPTTLSAFHNAWAEKGWKMVDGDLAYEEPGSAPLLEDKTKAQLLEIAVDLNITGRSSMDKSALIAAIEDAPDYQSG